MAQWLNEARDAVDRDYAAGKINFVTWRAWRDAVWDVMCATD
jgi:hypothetical protein